MADRLSKKKVADDDEPWNPERSTEHLIKITQPSPRAISLDALRKMQAGISGKEFDYAPDSPPEIMTSGMLQLKEFYQPRN